MQDRTSAQSSKGSTSVEQNQSNEGSAYYGKRSEKNLAGISLEDGDGTNQSEDGSIEEYREKKSVWAKIWSKIEIQQRGNLTNSQLYLYNFDLRPVEHKRRTWEGFNYIFFWIADSFNINTFQIAATSIGDLSVFEAWAAVWIGYSMTACFVVLSARIGSHYHTSFPVSSRASFGIFGALFPIIQRIFLAVIWYSVQAYIAADAIKLILKCICGYNVDTRIPNGIHSPNLTTWDFMCFFLFWLISLPFLWFPPHQIRHLFTVKAYVVPFAGFGFLIWVLVKAGGAGALIHESAGTSGSAKGWAFVTAVLNALANFSTLIVNAPDFSRFAKKPSSALWPQLLTIPIAFSITSLIGILVSSASANLTSDGSTLWSPLDILDLLIENNSSGARAGCFFISVGFVIAQLATNISANSLSAGTDMTAIAPRFMSIRRGSYVCAALALCITPWNMMSSSSNFLTSLSAFAVFLSSIAGIIMSDYYFVRRGKLYLFDLYSADAHCVYTYWKGVNWRAIVSYFAGILPNMVGFVGATGTHTVPSGATYVYDLNFFVGFIVAFIVYALLCYFFPVPGRPIEGWFVKGWFEKNVDVEDFGDIKNGALVEAGHGHNEFELEEEK